MNLEELNISDREFSGWSDLSGESIFITGGSGFIGSALLYSLIESNKKFDLNIKVTVLSRNISSFKIKHPEIAKSDFITLLEGDVRNFDFPKDKFSKLFHLATTSASETFEGEDQLRKYHTLVEGTERVLQFAAFSNVNKIIFTSSGVVYGQLPSEIKNVSETYLGAPDTSSPSSALAQGKRSAEFLISYYADKYGFDFVIARCFSFIGPNLPLNLHYAVGNFIFDAIHNETINIRGDGKSYRSYMDVNDLTVWLLKFMSNNCKHKIYNVGSDQTLSILSLAKKIQKIISPSKEIIIYGDTSLSIGNFSRDYYAPNINRALKEFSLDLWINLDQSIIRLMKKVENNA
jgi:dTDP-glucose 4,6-dehydratase/UDP-glucose 4-epimerase